MEKVLLIPSCRIGPELNELGPDDTMLRLKRGIEIWNKGGFDRILLVGGIFNPPHIQTIPAAELMKSWLVSQGVPGDCILCENQSLDTYENVSMGLDVLRQAGLEKAGITLVTQWQHAIRFWLTFGLGHGKRVRTIPMFYRISFMTFCLEMMFILHHVLFPTGKYSPLTAKNRSHRAQRKEA